MIKLLKTSDEKKILKQPEEIKTCIMESYADEGIFFVKNNASK